MAAEPAPGKKTITASEFRAKCLKLMDEVAATGEEVVITKHGRPVARLLPYRKRPATPFGRGTGKFEIIGDIISPVDLDWEVLR